MGSYTLIVLVLKYFLFWGFCPLWFLSFDVFVLRCFCPFWLFSVCQRDRITRMLIVHTCVMWSRAHQQKYDHTLDCWSIKIFSLLGILSPLIFIIWGFCPMVLLSILAFLCPPTWSHDENVDCPHLHHVITWTEIWSYTLIVGVSKIFSLLGVLSPLIFILWGFCPMVLLTILAFLCVPTWSHDENVDYPHLYHVITWTEMGSYTLIVGASKYFLFNWFCLL